MKKFFCLMLAIIITASLCGCVGGSEPEDVRGSVISENNTQPYAEGENETETEPEFSLGKATNNTYKNDFLDLSLTLPSEWVFYTDEQILELNNIVEDVIDEDVVNQLKNANIIYDMYATNETDSSNININLEKISTIQLIGLDVKEVLEGQIDTIKSTYENLGYTDISVNYEKITVDGEEFDSLNISAKIGTADFFTTVFTFRKGTYLANVSIGAFDANTIDTILSYFTVE